MSSMAVCSANQLNGLTQMNTVTNAQLDKVFAERNVKPQSDAILTLKALSPADKRAQMKNLIEDRGARTAMHKAVDGNLRGTLRELAKLVFAKPVTTAKAAEVLGVDLSTRGELDEAVKAYKQSQRVTLQQALKDAGRWVAGESKGGRKAADPVEKLVANFRSLSPQQQAAFRAALEPIGG